MMVGVGGRRGNRYVLSFEERPSGEKYLLVAFTGKVAQLTSFLRGFVARVNIF